MARIKPVEIKSKEECVELINDVARLEMDRRKQEIELKRKIQALQDEFGPGIVALQELIEGKVARISEYLDAHADAMFKKGTKSGETALAEFGFRIGNPTLGTAKKWKWDDVLAALKLDDLMRKYVRTKEEVQKDLIKSDYAAEKITPETLAAFGMKITQTESCWIEPKADAAV